MATKKFETKRQVLHYLKNLPDEDVIYYGNFIIDLANRPSTNDEISIIKDKHREELKEKAIEIQKLTEEKEWLEQLIHTKEDYKETLLDITKNAVIKAKDDVLKEKDSHIQTVEYQLEQATERQSAEMNGQAQKIANLEATINTFAGTRQKSATRGQQGEDFLESILKESKLFASVQKLNAGGDFLIRCNRSKVRIMIEAKDIKAQQVPKKDKDKFDRDLNDNSYDCGVLVSLSCSVDSSVDEFAINKSTKGKPFLYIDSLRSYEDPQIIMKVACLALVYSVKESSENEEKPTKSFIADQLQTFVALCKNSKDIKKQAEQLKTNAEENNKLVKKIYQGFQKLQKEIEEPAPSEPQAGSKRPRNEDDIENN